MSTAASSAMIVAALCVDRPVLSELRELFPEAWEVVYQELALLAEHQDPAQIAQSLTRAHQEWQKNQPQCLALQKRFNSRLAGQCGLQLIRKLALEQYARAVQQETLKTGGAAGLRDRLLLRLLILPMATARRALPYRLHRMAWRLLRNPAAATAMLLQAGCYLIAPVELIKSLGTLVGSRPTLEIGAGRGTLASSLRRSGIDITAVDDFSWADRLPMGSGVLQMDGREALERFKPQVVICCWPPPDNNFEQEIFSSPEVQDYLVIVSRHRYASGDHQAYAGAKEFRCVQATGQLAEMLLPHEAESVLYIFSRRQASGANVAKD